VYAWLDLQRTSYGLGYSSLRSLAGLAHLPGGIVYLHLIFVSRLFALERGARHHPPQHQEGGRPRHQVPAMGVALHHNQTIFLAAPGLAGGPRRHYFYPNYGFIPAAATPVE
jgi:hypothetical protein